jgi:predicted secreted protein
MSDIVFGNNAVLQVRIAGTYVNVGCAVSCSFEFENELIAKTDVNAGLFRKKRVRMSDSRMSVQGLTTLVDDTSYSPMYFLQEGVRRTEQDLRILFTDEGGISKQVQGSYLVKTIQMTGKADDFSEFDMGFEGTGTISLEDPDDSGSDIPGDVQWDWWEAVEGQNTITGAGHYGRSFAGEELILVDREGIQYDEVLSSPAGRQYSNSGSVISFDAALPFNLGERVYVIWQNV